MALHTTPGCTISHTGAFSGTLETDNCDINAAGQGNNVGCSIRDGSGNSFGNGFNGNGGGVYATEWTSQAINIWFFPRSAIPADLTSGNPDPSGWGQPQGQFTGGCDIDDKFQNMNMIFDVTFCGDWAGQVWSTDATCSSQGATCQAFVQNNPSAFKDTYWLVNSLRVYSDNGAAPAPTQSQPGISSTPASGPSVTASPIATTLQTLPSGANTVTQLTQSTLSQATNTSPQSAQGSTFQNTFTASAQQPTTNTPIPTPAQQPTIATPAPAAQPTTAPAQNPAPAPAPAASTAASNGGDPTGGNNGNNGGNWGGRGGNGGRGGGGGGRGGWGQRWSF